MSRWFSFMRFSFRTVIVYSTHIIFSSGTRRSKAALVKGSGSNNPGHHSTSGVSNIAQIKFGPGEQIYQPFFIKMPISPSEGPGGHASVRDEHRLGHHDAQCHRVFLCFM